jgi:hypothetical protein
MTSGRVGAAADRFQATAASSNKTAHPSGRGFAESSFAAK